MKKIGILTSGGDCGGLNAAIRSIFFRAKNKYGMTVFGIKNGTTGLVQRPLDFIELNGGVAAEIGVQADAQLVLPLAGQ